MNVRVIYIITISEIHKIVIIRLKWKTFRMEKKMWDTFNEFTQFRHKQLANIKKLVTSNGTVLSEFDKIADELAGEFVFENIEGMGETIIFE